MSHKKEGAAEEYQKAFKYFLKQPVVPDSLQKYLLSQGMTCTSNATFDRNNQDDVFGPKNEPASLRVAKVSKKIAPQTCGLKLKKRQLLENVEREVDSIKSDFKTATEELQSLKVVNSIKTADNVESDVKMRRQGQGGSNLDDVIDNEFKSAREVFGGQQIKRHASSNSLQGQKRRLGGRGGVYGKFVSPVMSNSDIEEAAMKTAEAEEVSDRLKNIDPKMVQLIRSEIMDNGPTIGWDDIAGLEFAKTSIQEAVVWPMLRPDIFTGLRRPPKAILLFGPPGTGKTLIGKCVASQSKSTFFSISASSLTSKWIGDGEKMVRALFSVARCHQPAVIFMDEIDSLLSQRSDTEHECSRRMKTEFLVQLDGATTDSEERILVIGATNRPQELDEAARRRFVKRLYIPLPVLEARRQLARQLMKNEKHVLSDENVVRIAELSDGYSGADIKSLCCEAALGPIRGMDFSRIETISAADVRPISMEDFENAFQRVKSSVAEKDLEQLITWKKTYGSNNSF